MACIEPPPIANDQLLLYLDGEADQMVGDHLAACSYCRARGSALENLQARLKARLYRRDCPSSQELGDFQLNLSTEARRLSIQTHINDCPHCAQELDQIEAYLSDLADDLSAPASSGVKILIARLVSGLDQAASTLSPAPAFAPVRGDLTSPLHFEVDGFEISVQIQPDPETPEKLVVLGLVLGDLEAGFSASLSRPDEAPVSGEIDELGNFVLPNVGKGTYALLIQGPAIEIHIQGLEI